MLRGRCRTTTYLYEDPNHPERVTSTVESPAYTEDDRALLLALAIYEDSTCTGCGQPKEHAWHGELDGWYEPVAFVCHGCTARNGGEPQAVYSTVRLAEGLTPEKLAGLPPLQLGVNTTPPDAST